jgi:hypothetical protein
MTCLRGLVTLKSILIAALMPLFFTSGHATGQTQKDPHRSACADSRCRKIEAFLKAHYCGRSPFGNGPEDGCELKAPMKLRAGIEVEADYRCGYADNKCRQERQPSSGVREILNRELQRLGLPAMAAGRTFFTVWKPTSSNWLLAAAYYSRDVGSKVEICQVIAEIGQDSQVQVLRQLPFQTTDADVPTVTQWIPIDLADVERNGQVDIILEADAYENHWLEVARVGDGTAETIFSGLGFYL